MINAGIIGLGRAGTVMAYMMAQKGYHVQVVLHNKPSDSCVRIKDIALEAKTLEQIMQKSDVLFITTPDKVVGSIVNTLQNNDLSNVKAVFHLSGALPVKVLLPLKINNIAIGSLHPLQSLADLDHAMTNLPGSTFTFDGDAAILPWVKSLVSCLGCNLVIAPPAMDKALYHAGACIASNYLIALAAMGMDCLKHSGFSDNEAQSALTSLMKGTLNNLGGRPPVCALTGPIIRGDTNTVRMHCDALKATLPDLLQSYSALGNLTAKLAKEAGNLPVCDEQVINELLDNYKSGC